MGQNLVSNFACLPVTTSMSEMSPQSSKKWNNVQTVAASPDEELVDVSDDDDEEDEIFDEMNLRLMALKTLPEMKPDNIEKQGTQQKGKGMY